MSVAAPGDVLVTGPTWGRLGEGWLGETLGRVLVKGRSAPVETWRVRASGATT